MNFVSLDALNQITCHLQFRVKFPKENVCSDEVSQHIIEKFVWDDLRAQTFTSLMCTDETCAILDEAISLIDLDIDKTLEIFNNCSKEKAECMKKQIRIKKNGRKLDEWFDWERRNVRRLLKKYRRSLFTDDRNAFCLARREYKNVLKNFFFFFISCSFGQTDFISEKSERLFGIRT